jgi:hypothetical protein
MKEIGIERSNKFGLQIKVEITAWYPLIVKKDKEVRGIE